MLLDAVIESLSTSTSKTSPAPRSVRMSLGAWGFGAIFRRRGRIRTKNNPALIGEAGAGKTVIVEGLAKGTLQVIGADTLDEYHRFVESDKALEPRFHPILVREPSVEQTIEILKGIAPRHGRHHPVRFAQDAQKAAAQLAERYISDRRLPDKAVDLLDEAGAHKHLSQIAIHGR